MRCRPSWSLFTLGSKHAYDKNRRSSVTYSSISVRPLSILLFFFFHAFVFYESQALHRQLCPGICYFLVTLLVLHMLFFGVFASNYALFFRVKLQKMLSTGNYATLWSFPAFTAVLCSTHVCTGVCMRVYKVHSLCAYSSTTQKHT